MKRQTIQVLTLFLFYLSLIFILQNSNYSFTNAQKTEETLEKSKILSNDEINDNNNCNISSLDSTVQWMFYLQHPNRRIPENLAELQEFCLEKDSIENQVDNYSKKCLSSLPKTLTELLMFGVRRQNRYYCSTSSKAKIDYLDSAKCLLAIKSTGEKCMDVLIVDMLSVMFSPSNKRIGRLCCVYYRFEDCLMNTMQEKCQVREIKRLEDLVHGYTGQMLSNVCLNYPKETDCSKLYPKREWNRARKEAEKRYKVIPKSILSPLIDVISSLPPNFGQ